MVTTIKGLVLAFSIHIALSMSIVLVDHLVPPPIEPRPEIKIQYSQHIGLMQRLARWLGFQNYSKEQLPQESNNLQQKVVPHNNFKINCNMCNKVPWIPMFPGNIQYPVLKGQSDLLQSQIKLNYLPSTTSLISHKPTYSNTLKTYVSDYSLQSIPVSETIKLNYYTSSPNYVTDLLPITNKQKAGRESQYFTPLYDLFSFNQQLTRNNHHQPSLKHKVKSKFLANQISKDVSTTGTPLEIMKSVPVADFVSSVEHPPDIIRSRVIDIQSNQQNHNESPLKFKNFNSSTNHNFSKSPKLYTNSIIVNNNSIFELQDSHPEASSFNVSYKGKNSQDSNFINMLTKSYDELIKFENTETTETTTVKVNTIYKNIIFNLTSAPPNFQYLKNMNITKKERQTPKQLLDSPIFYLFGSTPRPFTKNPSEINFRNFSQYEWHSSSTPGTFSTSTPNYSKLNASNHYSQPYTTFSPELASTRPKHIHQLIIPYTTKIKPRPFKIREEQSDQHFQSERFKNWFNSHEAEFHEVQESKLFTATQSPTKKTTQYLTKILASNLRELLKNEYDTQRKSKANFDISELQKNIDDWTEQEFTSSHKISTVSLRGRSKNIPTEYLTTTPANLINTTKIYNFTTKHDSLNKEIGRKNVPTKIFTYNLIDSTNSVKFQSANTSSSKIKTTLPDIKSITDALSLNEFWKNLKISISPLTNEKVYIVTPQPSSQDMNSNNVFKSPRFLVRPTPANNFRMHNTQMLETNYTPELFGLMAYNPSTPVETLDGHSKVITVITASPINIKSDNSSITENVLPIIKKGETQANQQNVN